MLKSSIALALASCATIGGAFAAIAPAPAPIPAPASAPDVLEIAGEVGQWRLEMDGRLLLRLDRSAATTADAPTPAWFQVDAQIATDVPTGHMLVEILLALEQAPDDATVVLRGKLERTLDGETAENAVPLLSIERRR